ncbi:hypothetical protein [Pandoraea anhela]|uniref:hypothetical protein n=1 Tax=Pandoraea anhela TaxID=2508295 RepID=UPI001FE62F05
MFGLLSDVIGRRKVLMIFGVSTTLFSVPLFTALSHTRDPLVAFALSFAGLVMLSGFTSVHMLAKTELFPPSIRALAVALRPFPRRSACRFPNPPDLRSRFAEPQKAARFAWHLGRSIAVEVPS